MQTFKKEERLSGEKIIGRLFESGTIFYISPFKVSWIHADFDSKFPAKVLIAVSRKNFGKAVDRNHIKRLTREAYRKNKYILYDALSESSGKCAFMLMYTGKIIIPAKEVEYKIILILRRLVKEYEKSIE